MNDNIKIVNDKVINDNYKMKNTPICKISLK